MDALLQAAKEVFAASGVDAPVRDIADKAGVGIGTFYRHFPVRSDLITAVFKREIDTCADAAQSLATECGPFEALARWIERYAAFIATKRGLAGALHSGDSAYEALPRYFDERLRPALQTLLDAATASSEVRHDVDADDIIGAVASLSMFAKTERPEQSRRVVRFFIDGLRHGADQAGAKP